MLSEEEYAEASRLYSQCMTDTKELRQQSGLSLEYASIDERFRSLREWYERLTGVPCHQNAIMHHRLRLFGDPCRVCGRLLRSPRAKRCAACGMAV